ncbi:two-component system sensor histidine kinase YesM [Paenibacillus taihuensis]|uniref:Two-component system sensor histidine kinase YesM n=1 Tax=Paenibacillus taihuensis TaxID=1156355 RepID=A0A3D9SDF0_9BACL|nr:sensor histidine kinase [Paenibacillus taihuensis]REE92918.1 two-component system sensor histidine kinase YesM [Paenibacillus taihuensis]
MRFLQREVFWNSIGVKVFVLYFVSMTFTVAVMGFLSFTKSTSVIQSNAGAMALQTIEQTEKRLQMILDEYDNRSQVILGYQELQKGIIGNFSDYYDRVKNTGTISNFITNMVNSKNDTVSINIIGKYDTSYRYSVITSTGFSVLPAADPALFQQEWCRQIIAADGKVVRFGIGYSFMPINSPTYENNPVYAFGRALKDLQGRGEIIGVLLYEIYPKELQNILREIDFSTSGNTFIMKRSGEIIANDPEKALPREMSELSLPDAPQGTDKAHILGKDELVVYREMEGTDWILVGMVPMKNLFKDTMQIKTYTLYLALIFVVVAIILTYIAGRFVHKPVYTLLYYMKKAREGDFEAKIPNRRSDEFGVLFDSFNVMLYRIKQLIDELYVQRILKKETQLKMLASQINAHFIYNTLDSIHWISRIYKIDTISTMIFGLSKYLRLSLSDGREFVTVDEAVELVESYLSIQKARYEDKFTVDVTVDPSVRQNKVLKFLFQPLVENAIYHGIENLTGTGEMHISWKKVESRLVFTVRDNGVGIKADDLERIRSTLEQTDISENFALRNINAQIKLTYGTEYGLTLESEAGIGTCVTMSIPLKD